MMLQQNSLKNLVISNDTEALNKVLSDNNNRVVKGELNNLFILAASFGHVGIANILLNHGANINATMPFGDTALMWAIIRKREDMVSFLIQQKINVNAENIAGNTALIFAAKEEQLGIMQQLIAAGADIDKTNKKQQTAFMVAEQAGKKQAMELLGGANTDNMNLAI